MEAIDVLERRFNLFPARFSWEGRVYEVDAVTECRTELAGVDRDETYHFWVRCNGQLLHLRQVVASDRWLVQYD